MYRNIFNLNPLDHNYASTSLRRTGVNTKVARVSRSFTERSVLLRETFVTSVLARPGSQNENFTASCNSRGLFPFARELTTAAVP